MNALGERDGTVDPQQAQSGFRRPEPQRAIGHPAENPVIAGGIGKAAAKAAGTRAAAVRRRKDYTAKELRAIFSSQSSPSNVGHLRGRTSGRLWYWLPLLMYYAGARRENWRSLPLPTS